VRHVLSRWCGLVLLLVIASMGVAKTLQRTSMTVDELPDPTFPTSPLQLCGVRVNLAPTRSVVPRQYSNYRENHSQMRPSRL
jgi:hypothetical protein